MRNIKGSAILIVIFLILVSATAGLGYFYVKNQPIKEGNKPIPEITQTITPTASPTAVAEKVVVVFEAAGSFSQSEKDELTKKVISPYLDYYEMENTEQILLTLTIAKNSADNKSTYPYSVSSIFKGGGNAGFMVMKEGTGLAWWLPDCLDGCKLTAAYKAKYPEIASKVE